MFGVIEVEFGFVELRQDFYKDFFEILDGAAVASFASGLELTVDLVDCFEVLRVQFQDFVFEVGHFSVV